MTRRLVHLVFLACTCVALLSPAVAADSDDVAYDAGLQWGLERIGAEAAWEVARGTGVTIAVVDSGAALDHEDLRDNLLPGIACLDTDGDPDRCAGSPQDDDGHGTHVAGIAAAMTGNEVGIAGTAPEARVLPVKVLFRSCAGCPPSGNALDVAAAIRWAARQGADIINLSLGSTTSEVFGPSFADAVTEAWAMGSIPVVAAGNEYVLTADLGDAPAVIVAATDRNDAAPPYSDDVGGARWAIAAPGGDGDDTPSTCAQDGTPRGILSTYWAEDEPRSAYACLSGTSMAAPHVSGALAILLSAGLGPEAAVQRLLDTANDIGPPGPDARFGHGLLDLEAAVRGITPGPRPTTTGPITPATPVVDDGDVTSTPQLFDPAGGRDVPTGVVALAVLLVLAAAVAAGEAVRRGIR